MRRLILLAAVAALFLVALPVASAGAAPPEQVTFEGPSFFRDGTVPGHGTFKTTGPAFDSGSVCGIGTTLDLYTKAAPKMGPSPRGVNLQILKEFTCNDGTGTFFVKLQVRIDFTKGTTFNWVIVGGTDDYEDLKGNGSGFVASPIPLPPADPIGVYDVYEGKLH
ncbi:MAG: hypothetical protein U9R47_03175 [Actinomycetota bacterium]|nr:hypothetical protein [Actinomycetota bacterium]